ncbi:MAG TPA: glutathione synthase, partial [Alcanivorax sp.]|nr:glutathione synthase [Alcanivorax sp.]HBT05184.1 glutathione synthase [Alcanivorax sp.]
MSLNIGVVMDPIAQIKPWKDTTLAMLLEAQRRGWNLHYMEPADLYVRDGRVFAVTSDLTVRDDNQDWFTLGEPAPRDLTGMDMILMRQDPPFDAAYLYATYLLEKVEREGVLVANRPASVRDSNEKLFATDFPQCCVPTLVSGRAALLREFVKEQGDTVMKPLDAMGGTNVFRIEPGSSNLSVIIDVLTEDGKTPIMAQRFVPEIKQGDKRILMING